MNKPKYIALWSHEVDKIDSLIDSHINEKVKFINITYAIDIRRLIIGITSLINSHLIPLHESGFIHGDISPSNILISSSGFRLIDTMGTKIGNVAVGGTPGWCAPEQSSGDPVSAKTDIYAIGLLLTLMLGGIVGGEESAVWIAVKKPGTSKLERKRIVAIRNPKITLDKR